jgi:hypothetical protein
MNAVVTFLSRLCIDEANSSVKRMLSICSEFERIARLVIEKADREASTRRKRKQQETREANAAAAAAAAAAATNGIKSGTQNGSQSGSPAPQNQRSPSSQQTPQTSHRSPPAQSTPKQQESKIPENPQASPGFNGDLNQVSLALPTHNEDANL